MPDLDGWAEVFGTRMIIKNTSNRDRCIPMQPSVILAPQETREVSRSELVRLDGYPMFRNWVHMGHITVIGDEVVASEPEAEEVIEDGVSIEDHGNGWYSVHVNGFKVTDVKVREDEAQRIAADYGI